MKRYNNALDYFEFLSENYSDFDKDYLMRFLPLLYGMVWERWDEYEKGESDDYKISYDDLISVYNEIELDIIMEKISTNEVGLQVNEFGKLVQYHK